jgi:hypothetical protein
MEIGYCCEVYGCVLENGVSADVRGGRSGHHRGLGARCNVGCRELGRRRLGSTVIHAAVYKVSTWLEDISSRYVLITVVDGVLHLLEDLTDVDIVVLSLNTGK